MNKIFLNVYLSALTLIATSPAALAQETAIFVDAQSESYSDSFSIDGLVSGLEGTDFKTGGDGSFTHNQIYLGAEFAPRWASTRGLGFSGGLTSRYDYAVSYAPDTAAYFYAAENDQELADGIYKAQLGVSHIQGSGLWARVDYDISDTIGLWGRASVLHTNALYNGYISGELGVDDGDIDNVTVTLDYYFSKDLIFDNSGNAPDGTGIAIDLGAQWVINDQLNMSLTLGDIYSQINWSDAPRTQADATTDNVSENDDGTLNVRATLEGLNTIEDFTQTLKPRSTAQVDYKLNDRWDISQNIFNLDETWLTRSSARYQALPDLYIGAHREWVSGAMGVSADWNGLNVLLMSDSLEIDKARYLRADVGVSYTF